MTIVITTNIPGRYGYEVACGERSTGELSWDEMLGTVASLTIPNGGKPCLNWLKTDAEREADYNRWHLNIKPPLTTEEYLRMARAEARRAEEIQF